jgi:hypothetical protein
MSIGLLVTFTPADLTPAPCVFMGYFSVYKFVSSRMEQLNPFFSS